MFKYIWQKDYRHSNTSILSNFDRCLKLECDSYFPPLTSSPTLDSKICHILERMVIGRETRPIGSKWNCLHLWNYFFCFCFLFSNWKISKMHNSCLLQDCILNMHKNFIKWNLTRHSVRLIKKNRYICTFLVRVGIFSLFYYVKYGQ